MALEQLAERREHADISTDGYLTMLDVVEENQPALGEDISRIRRMFEFNRRLTHRLLDLRAQPYEEQAAWTQYGIDGLQEISQNIADQCQGPRKVLVPGAYYLDGQPHYEVQCTGAAPDIIRRLLS